MTKSGLPLHIGIANGTVRNGKHVDRHRWYITAEYMNGFETLAEFNSLKAAKEQLPKLKRAYLVRANRELRAARAAAKLNKLLEQRRQKNRTK